MVLKFVLLEAPSIVLLQQFLVRFPQRLQFLGQLVCFFFSLRGPVLHLASVLLLHDVLGLREDRLFLQRNRLFMFGFSQPIELGLKLSNP